MTYENDPALILVESNTSGTGYVLAGLANNKGIKVFLITDGLVQYQFEDFVTHVLTDTNDLEKNNK